MPMGSDDGVRSPKSGKDIVRNFAPAWFAVNMGTGAISLLFYAFPYGNGSQGLNVFALIFFFLNLVLFATFVLVQCVRYAMFPDIWWIMLYHPVQSLYLGCMPMGATTLLNIAVNLINEDYGFGGKAFLYALWGLWWLDVAISALCCFGMVHFMKTRQRHSLEKMTSVWLLPVVTFIVASSSGGVIALPLAKYSSLHALITITTSICLVTIGVSLAFMMLTVYLLRLIVHGLPPGATIVSVFLPLGPMGQAGYSVLLIGQVLDSILPYGNFGILAVGTTGHVIHVICLCISMMLWALTTMWVVYAFLAMHDVLRRNRYPFKLPFWGLIFPNGVYANLTLALARALDSRFFRVYGAIYSIFTLILWIFVSCRTIMLLRGGQIFEAPCLEDVDMTRFNTRPTTSESKVSTVRVEPS
ncbi:hypothetical protein HGRIS_002725 [Hohenbuehelia grisea]|uniref:C4-dicarboxylate transporter/malic acid transport protein n=1 Tax=Hohenbuehelia grisea TaxID=104357 RepID=A0ABR3JM37_9AGAR